jgi:SNF2 family DNA or RNA helicase
MNNNNTINNINNILKDFQKEGIQTLYDNEKTHGLGSILAYDMGLGKTMTMSSFLIQQRIKETPEHADLIVVPLAVLNQWKKEILRLDETRKVFIYHGPKRVKELGKEIDGVDFVISTFHSLVTRELECYEWNRVVVDEAHTLRNGIETKFRSVPKKVIGAYALQEVSKYRYCITGTPYNNRNEDIMSLMKFIGHEHTEDRIPEFIKNCVLQKTKEGIMEAVNTEIINIKKPENIKDYDNLERMYYSLLSQMAKANGIDAKALYLRAMGTLSMLRVYCDLMKPSCMKRVITGEDDDNEYYEDYIYTYEERLSFYDSSIKIKTICDKANELIYKVHKKRIIIFSSFVSVLEVIEAVLNERNKDVLTFKYIGSLNRDQRQVIIDSFTNEDETRPMILLASLGASSCGLNLTPCSTVFLADISNNPFDQIQAVNRVHRITQTEQVNVYKFCMKDMIEESLLRRQEDKIQAAKDSGLIMVDDIIINKDGETVVIEETL